MPGDTLSCRHISLVVCIGGGDEKAQHQQGYGEDVFHRELLETGSSAIDRS
jgi:hypothetical protein